MPTNAATSVATMKPLWILLFLTTFSSCLVPVDAGSFNLADAAQSPDGGFADAGATVRDAGVAVADAGVVTPDAGVVMADAGVAIPDAGAAIPDAGAVVPEADAGPGALCPVRIFDGQDFVRSMSIEGPGRLSLRFADLARGWRSTNVVVTFDGGLVSSVDESTHEGAGFGSLAQNGRGTTLILGGTFTPTQYVSILDQRSTIVLSDIPDTADWTVHDAVYDPMLDQFALFWVSPRPTQIMMQSRFLDGGVGFTTPVVADFLSKPSAASWAPGRYVLLGTSTVYSVEVDGGLRGSLPINGRPTAVATDLADGAGVLVHGLDGGSLSFTQVSGTNGTMTARSFSLLSGIRDAVAAMAWDPIGGGWHVVFAARPGGQLTLATFTPAGGLLRVVPLGCAAPAQVDEVSIALSDRFLFVAYGSFLGPVPAGVLRVDL